MRFSVRASAAGIIGGRTFTSLRNHYNYRLYFSGQFLSQVGTWLQSAAMAWLVLQLTNSAFAVGLLAFWQFGPYALLGLFGGALADRLDHRNTLILTQVALALCSTIIAVLTLTHVVVLWEVYTIAAMRGLALVLNNPSRQAFIFQMVGRDELPNAIALNSSLANATRILGPGIGGILIASFGVGVCFAIDALSYVAVIIALLFMRVDELLSQDRGPRTTMWTSVVEGLGFVRRTPNLRLALGIFTIIATVCINFSVLLPLVASDTLRSDARVYGLITACFGAGALAGALISASIGRVSWPILLASAAGFGLGELLLAPQRTVLSVVALIVITGICYTIYTSTTNAMVQLSAPPYLQGRVAGLYSYIFAGSSPFGALIAGSLAARGGTDLAFLVAGCTALACAAYGVFARPRDNAGVAPAAHADHDETMSKSV